MFAKNMGQVDRIIRIVVGLALILAFFLGAGGGLSWLLLVIGIVALATGLMSSCPAYSIFGIKTCKSD